MILNINYVEVKKTGVNILELSKEFSDNVTKLNNIIDNLNNVWNGQDSADYINKIREGCIPGLKKISDIMEKYGNYLCKVPNAYKTLDNNALNKNKQVGGK